jgi:hypothetical protein
MYKIFKFFLIKLFAKDVQTAAKIYNLLYNSNLPSPIPNVKKDSKTKVTPVKDVKPVSSKKQEILDSLSYLKSKKIQTKQDKESIYTLEMVLKNM